VKEGPVALSQIRQGSITPSVHQLPTFEQRHNIPEFMQISRDALRQLILAGAERNRAATDSIIILSPICGQPQSLRRSQHQDHEDGIELLPCSVGGAQANYEAQLNGNEEDFVVPAPCAFKGAQIKARSARLDADQPHRYAASRAIMKSKDRNTARTWIGVSRQHDNHLKTRRERDTLSHRSLPVVGR
jgi:hypothetical protein